jgi:hypothetical protein
MKLQAIFCCLLSSFILQPSGFAQGPLPPPGPPGPTMKTLDQIDGKLDTIDAKLDKRTPISSLPFTIGTSGSYYLTGNLQFTAATGHAITITVSNVTLDLMGFTLSSSSAVTGDAIHLNGPLRNIAVTNGVIAGQTTVTVSGTAPDQTWSVVPAGFAYGVNPGASGNNCHFSNLRVSGCRETGLGAGGQAVVTHVTATQNGEAGITITDDGTAANCSASFNGGIGISASSASVTNSSASSNGKNGISAFSVANSKADGNGGTGISALSVSGATSTFNNGAGIVASSVFNSTADHNGGHGIFRAGGYGTFVNCLANSNKFSGFSATYGTVTSCSAQFNGSNGISAPNGVVAFCKAEKNNTANNGSEDIDAVGATRTGNNPTP